MKTIINALMVLVAASSAQANQCVVDGQNYDMSALGKKIISQRQASIQRERVLAVDLDTPVPQACINVVYPNGGSVIFDSLDPLYSEINFSTHIQGIREDVQTSIDEKLQDFYDLCKKENAHIGFVTNDAGDELKRDIETCSKVTRVNKRGVSRIIPVLRVQSARWACCVHGQK